jgi:hypothetical protein
MSKELETEILNLRKHLLQANFRNEHLETSYKEVNERLIKTQSQLKFYSQQCQNITEERNKLQDMLKSKELDLDSKMNIIQEGDRKQIRHLEQELKLARDENKQLLEKERVFKNKDYEDNISKLKDITDNNKQLEYMVTIYEKLKHDFDQ